MTSTARVIVMEVVDSVLASFLPESCERDGKQTSKFFLHKQDVAK